MAKRIAVMMWRLACVAGMACAMQPALAAAAAPSSAKCAALARLALPDARITTAEMVAAGQYRLPSSGPGPLDKSGMNVAGRLHLDPNPAFCRVAATLRPSKDSDIKIEVWLPQSGWNGKFLGVGNFGWGGSLMYSGMLTGVLEGYASASTDTGHDGSAPGGGGGQFALGHPEKLIDYAYRADHEMTVKAKALIKAYYGVAPARSYWIGCSLGGLEGLIEAKRYPQDYDGIVVGAPPNPLVHINAAQLWPGWLVAQEPQRLIPEAKYAMVHDAVLKACASPLGQKEGLVDDPARCDFDPAQLQCKGADQPDCLTAPQVDLLRQIYAGPRDPRSGKILFPGPARGSERELYMFASGRPFNNALDLYRYAAFGKPDWDARTMDWARDVAAADAKLGPLLHVDSDLRPFFAHGGRLLMYIGWNDYHNPQELIGYYQAVAELQGADADRHVRLFTIPGMNHCAGGPGCDTFDKLGTIDAWVDRETPPERIVATKAENGTAVRTRPLCRYPTLAVYKGSGDTNDAASFSCAPPPAR